MFTKGTWMIFMVTNQTYLVAPPPVASRPSFVVHPLWRPFVPRPTLETKLVKSTATW